MNDHRRQKLWQGADLDIDTLLLHNEEYHPIFLQNISEYGINFTTKVPINIGDEVEIYLNLLNVYCIIYDSSLEIFKGIFRYPIDIISIIKNDGQGAAKN